MSVLLIFLLTQLVRVMSQSTVLHNHCGSDCEDFVEIQRLTGMMENMERIIRDTNDRSEKLTQQTTMLQDEINRLKQENKNQTDTISQLRSEISDLRTYDCEHVRGLGYQASGVYNLNIITEVNMKKLVFCEMTAEGGAWTRILHRQDDLTDFDSKTWKDYEAGFGDPLGSQWMGLIQIHRLTASRAYKLRVDLTDWEGETRYAEYSTFQVGPNSDKYKLNIGGYNGTAGDALTYHNNMYFTTKDNDNDEISRINCATGHETHSGGWWYRSCHDGRLTGIYYENGNNVGWSYGIQWPNWRGRHYSYKIATMKIQRL